jgi:chromosome segregation ATPase
MKMSKQHIFVRHHCYTKLNMEKEKKGGSNKLVLIALILSLGFNIYQWSDGKKNMEQSAAEVDSLVTARTDIEKTLTDTYNELNQYKGINTKLDSLLAEATGKVDEQKERIQDLIKKEKNNFEKSEKLQEELIILNSLRDEYMEKVDSLLVENENLKKERDDLSTTVASLTKNLETTVSTASVLKSEYFKVTSLRKKNGNKYSPTIIAKRTNRIETCFALLENSIAHNGERKVYMRIVEPGGKVLGDKSLGSGTFTKAGSEEEVNYTSSKLIEYKNEKMDMCLDWEDIATPFNSGSYMIEIYIDGALSGATSITLR